MEQVQQGRMRQAVSRATEESAFRPLSQERLHTMEEEEEEELKIQGKQRALEDRAAAVTVVKTLTEVPELLIPVVAAAAQAHLVIVAAQAAQA